ncbi:hypothetical protein E1301_Tti011244 [Triplophysa tibetana]|uniref:Uncharacterized protein n=1 Tax=Triplophysa tibetana TaxID=1572043 RepID=A0A5A9MZ81_9TELE|nr:hypothetical protein E1301_Tti011244 [Triplophysa tibetana]
MMSSEAGSVISQKIVRLFTSSESTVEGKTANVRGAGCCQCSRDVTLTRPPLVFLVLSRTSKKASITQAIINETNGIANRQLAPGIKDLLNAHVTQNTLSSDTPPSILTPSWQSHMECTSQGYKTTIRYLGIGLAFSQFPAIWSLIATQERARNP